MAPDEAPAVEAHDIRAAWLVSVVSVAWTAVAGAAALTIGMVEGSVVLEVFGLVGFVDGVGSAALAHHFARGLRYDGLADHLEVLAHRIVIVGLLGVGTAAVVLGAVRLAGDPRGGSSTLGSALAAVSLVALAALATVKRRVAARVGSRALRSDGHLSAIGAAQAAVALAGVAAASVGWPAADPVAAVAIGVVTIGLGVQARSSG